MVPPRSSRPLTDELSSVRVRGRPIRPSKPSSMPSTDQPWSTSADLTTARMTAFSPGASPPLVSTPMRRIGAVIWVHPSFRWVVTAPYGQGNASVVSI